MRNVATLVACMLCLAPGIGRSQAPDLPSVTAIDIALEPDATMMEHANALNARLRQSFPKGYALDATHHPHITMLQRYVRTADLPKIYAAVRKIRTEYNVGAWNFEAFKIDHAVWSGLAVTVILAKPPRSVLEAQQRLIDAIAPYTVQIGTAAAFATTPAEPDINASTIAYVTAFVPKSTGKNYIAHVTCGVASVAFVKQLEAEPFSSFTFSPVAISVYQLGNFGTARKKLEAWSFAP
ncbi:MAG TPA: hypothetical protein VMT95_02015 [Candidatus Binatia bacterium]|nr:hypothetical protein [Candidatus Binatia bacterium]